MNTSKKTYLPLIPGLLLSAALAAVAIQLGKLGWLQAHGLSALTVAIVLGIFLGNTLYPLVAARSGAARSGSPCPRSCADRARRRARARARFER